MNLLIIRRRVLDDILLNVSSLNNFSIMFWPERFLQNCQATVSINGWHFRIHGNLLRVAMIAVGMGLTHSHLELHQNLTSATFILLKIT